MLYLSEIIIANQEFTSFEELEKALPMVAQTSGERFFRMDVKPPYPDTPESWEDRLEAAFASPAR